MPDDPAFPPPQALLRGLDPRVLMNSRELLHSTVKENEVVNELEQPTLLAHQEQILVELEACVIRLILLPLEEVLLRGANRAVLHAFRIVAGEHDLHRREERLVELLPLIREQLSDPVPDRHPAVLELDDPNGDAVQVQDEIRASLKVAPESYFFGYCKVILPGLCPVD